MGGRGENAPKIAAMQTPSPSAPLLDAPEMAARIASRLPAFTRAEWLDVTGSTNADMLARVREGQDAAQPWLRGTYRQDSGRGRAGRVWTNHAGDALMFSCAFDVPLPLAKLPALSPISGIAACEALRAQAGAAAPSLRMKWPNDLQFGDGKLAGILVETARAPGEATPVVVMGIGINLREAGRLSAELGREIADWTQVRGGLPAAGDTLATLVADVARAWLEAVVQYARQGYAPFISRHAQVDALAGREVNVIEDGRVLFSGLAQGTDGDGRLLVDAGQGRVPISVGEISVRAR